MKILNQWAVVTGASKGLGFAYCKELLKKGYHIFGVSRDASNILSLQKDYPDLKIQYCNLDLSVIENVYKLYQLTEELNVTILINNAGFGILGDFQESDINTELNLINVNIVALTVLSKLFLQRFLRYNYGRIINISSMAAFIPGPGFSVYYASKAYVQSLSVAINYEIKSQKTRVRVVSVCPGLLKTEFFNRAKASAATKNKGKTLPIIDLDVYARKSLKKALLTKKDFIVIGFWNRLAYFNLKFMFKKMNLRILYFYQKNR